MRRAAPCVHAGVVRCALAGVLAAAIAGCSTLRPAPEFLSSPATRDAGLPFSDAVRIGDLVFVSGQLGTRPGTLELVPGGIGPETRQTLENIGAILERSGSSLDRVVKCSVFLADIDEWSAMNAEYVAFFPAGYPARSALQAAGLAFDARVEIECIAAAGQDPTRSEHR